MSGKKRRHKRPRLIEDQDELDLTELVPPSFGHKPSSLTPDRLKQLRNLLTRGVSIVMAARLIGIAETTIHRARRHENFKIALEHWVALGLDAPHRKLFIASEAGEPWAIKFALQHRHPEFIPPQQQVGGKFGSSTRPEDPDEPDYTYL